MNINLGACPASWSGGGAEQSCSHCHTVTPPTSDPWPRECPGLSGSRLAPSPHRGTKRVMGSGVRHDVWRVLYVDINKSITSQAPPNPLHFAWENRDPQRKSGSHNRTTGTAGVRTWVSDFWFRAWQMDSLPSWTQSPRLINSVKESKELKWHRISWKWKQHSPWPKQDHIDSPGCKDVWDSRE